MLQYLYILLLLCINFIVFIFADLNLHVLDGCAKINREDRCAQSWDFLGLIESKRVSCYRDEGADENSPCLNRISILLDFPYSRFKPPLPWEKPGCELLFNLEENDNIIDLYVVYVISQRTMCLTFDQKSNADENHIINGAIEGCCSTGKRYTGTTSYSNPYAQRYLFSSRYDGPATRKLCYDCPNKLKKSSKKHAAIGDTSLVIAADPDGSNSIQTSSGEDGSGDAYPRQPTSLISDAVTGNDPSSSNPFLPNPPFESNNQGQIQANANIESNCNIVDCVAQPSLDSNLGFTGNNET